MVIIKKNGYLLFAFAILLISSSCARRMSIVDGKRYNSSMNVKAYEKWKAKKFSETLTKSEKMRDLVESEMYPGSVFRRVDVEEIDVKTSDASDIIKPKGENIVAIRLLVTIFWTRVWNPHGRTTIEIFYSVKDEYAKRTILMSSNEKRANQQTIDFDLIGNEIVDILNERSDFFSFLNYFDLNYYSF